MKKFRWAMNCASRYDFSVAECLILKDIVSLIDIDLHKSKLNRFVEE